MTVYDSLFGLGFGPPYVQLISPSSQHVWLNSSQERALFKYFAIPSKFYNSNNKYMWIIYVYALHPPFLTFLAFLFFTIFEICINSPFL